MDYITFIRSKVGHDEIFLNCSGGAIIDDKGRVLLGRRADVGRFFPRSTPNK